MLLSPAQENLAPQGWAIKEQQAVENFSFSTGRIAERPDCEKAEESRERNPGISQASVAFSSSRTNLASSLLQLYDLRDNHCH